MHQQTTTHPQHAITVGCGLRRPTGRRVPLGRAKVAADEAFAAVLDELDPSTPAWWSPHSWMKDRRESRAWEGSIAYGVDLDFYVMGRPPGKGHMPPTASARDALESVLRQMLCTLDHQTPRGHRIVIVLDEVVRDRHDYQRAAEAVAACIDATLAAARILGNVDRHGHVLRAGYVIDRKALLDLARMYWAPSCAPDDGQPPRRAELRLGRGRPYTLNELLAVHPAACALPASAATILLPPTSSSPPSSSPLAPAMGPTERLYAVLKNLPSARDYPDRGVSIVCPFHPDTHPSAIVFYRDGGLHCSACGVRHRMREWVGSPQGRLLLGDTLAKELLALHVVHSGPSLASLVVPLTFEALRAPQLPRDYLVRDADGVGVLPRGRVAMLGAPGGAGKSWAMVGLATSVAAGTQWFGAWPVEQGRVLLVLAEEDCAEAKRRLHFALKASDDVEVNAVAANVTVVPASGVGLALTFEADSNAGSLPETPRAEELRALLRAAVAERNPYSLVVLDPLSRFAGPDVEKDNAAATRYVQVLETLTTAECGRPTVLVPAHTRKRSKDDEPGSTDPLRGSSALRDGARWVAMLERRLPREGAAELIDFKIGKSNYTRRTALVLCADSDREGALRAATEEEVATYVATKTAPRARESEKTKRNDELAERIWGVLLEGPTSINGLVEQLKAGRERVIATTEVLAAEGRIVRIGGKNGGWQVVSMGGPDHHEVQGGLWSGGLAPKGGRRPDHQSEPQTVANPPPSARPPPSERVSASPAEGFEGPRT